MRSSAIGLVLELEPTKIWQEELDHANDLCYDTNWKLYRIITFWLEWDGIAELASNLGLTKARISFILKSWVSPNEWTWFQVEEIIMDSEVTID